MLYRVCYSSKATAPMTEAGLEDILAAAHRNNDADGVTGVLLYTEGYFLQILEGERQAVERTLVRIAGDPRHEALRSFGATEVPEREFEKWRMAFLNPSADELAQWIGLDAAETKESLLAQLEANPHHMPQFLKRLVELLG
jgi:hypothetical protein